MFARILQIRGFVIIRTSRIYNCVALTNFLSHAPNKFTFIRILQIYSCTDVIHLRVYIIKHTLQIHGFVIIRSSRIYNCKDFTNFLSHAILQIYSYMGVLHLLCTLYKFIIIKFDKFTIWSLRICEFLTTQLSRIYNSLHVPMLEIYS